jgi:hypothetical protein
MTAVLWAFISGFSGLTIGLAIGLRWKIKTRRSFKPAPAPYNPVIESFAPDREYLPGPEPYLPKS